MSVSNSIIPGISMRIANSWLRAITILLFFFLVFSSFRLILLLAQWDQFSDLGLGEILSAFIYGLRFDASTIAVSIGLPLLMVLLPYHWAQSPAWQNLWLWLIYLIFLILLFTLIGDLIYFSYVDRHVGNEITLMLDDMALFTDMAFSDYGWGILLFLAAGIIGRDAWKYFIPRHSYNPLNGLSGTVAVLALFAIIVLIVRGGFQYKPITVADAFTYSNSPEQGYLVVNGAFSVQRNLTAPKFTMPKFMPDAQAIELVQNNVISAGTNGFEDQEYPLVREAMPPAKSNSVRSSATTSQPNIVLMILESWDARHVDSLRALEGEKPLGLTPHFDALTKEGRLYTRFYANGRRSIEGLASLLASVPSLPSLPYLGKGMEQSRLPFLGRLAKQENYETIFLQSSNRGSFHIDAIAASAGFDAYFGAEDIVPDPEWTFDSQSSWGVWDHYAFNKADIEFQKTRQPFLGLVFSSTSHNPWRVPDKRWEIRPENDSHSRYMNTVYYSDWALGEFINKAKKSGYYDNTIFIVTGDHIGPFGYREGEISSRYHVPLLIVGPGISAGMDDSIASQMDILPTLIELAGWDVKYSGFGNSILADNNKRSVFAINDKLVDYFNESGWISHNLDRVVSQHDLRKGNGKNEIQAADYAKMEQELLAIYQITGQLIIKNRLYK